MAVEPDTSYSSWVSRKPPGPSEQIKTLQGMAMNFLACDREQPFLMPPDPRDWLPEDHLAWFVLASVEEMDLSAFFTRAHMANGQPGARSSRASGPGARSSSAPPTGCG